MVIASSKILTRVQVLHMRVLDKKPLAGVAAITGVSPRVSQKIVQRALERGMDPDARPFVIQPEWVADAPRSGRPSKQTLEVRALTEQAISRDRFGREKSSEAIAETIKECTGRTVSDTTIWRILR